HRGFREVSVRNPPVATGHHGVLHERHAYAADHAADALAARRLRVDDAAGPVGADDAPDARLTEIRIDGDLHEYGAEGMHGEPLALVAWLYVGCRFDRLANAAHGIREVVAPYACKGVLARLAASGLPGACHAPADQPAPIAHRARLGVALAPAEAFGGDPVALPRRAAGEGQFLELVLLGFVAQAQRDRIDVQCHRQFVHRRFDREDAARFAGSAHVRRRVHVHGCDAMARIHARARMQEPARVNERLRKLLVRGRLLKAVMHDGGEAAVTRGAECDALPT